jgi:enamine deaminase RidA (YjgF/YER057c/UK114 family)
MNPAALSKPTGYTHVVTSTGAKTIYIAGQVALDKEGKLVGTDLRSQTVQIFENLKIALADAGATFDDVVKMTTYVVNHEEQYRAILREVREKYLRADRPPANTLVGVQALALRGFLVEIEAIAVVER